MLLVDGQECARQQTTANTVVFAMDTRGFADGGYSLSVMLEPAGFPTVYISPAVSAVFDNTPPTANNLCPSDRAVLNHPAPLIQATLADNLSGIAPESVELFVCGESVPVELQANGIGLIARHMPWQALAEGDVDVALAFSDRAGNVAVREWSFVIDLTPPPAPRLYEAVSPIEVLENQAIVRLATSKDTAAVEAQVRGESALAVQSSATADELLWTISLTDLAEGENHITAAAVDAAGNRSEALVFVVKVGIPDKEPPIILSFAPASGAVFEEDEITLAGEAMNHAYARTTVTVWRVSGNSEILVWEGASEQIEKIAGPDDQGRFIWQWSVPGVKLGRGLNRVEIMGQDQAGNTSTVQAQYFLNPLAAGEGKEDALPLDRKTQLFSFWPRDPEDIVAHRLQVQSRTVWNDPYYGQWEWINTVANVPTNFTEADCRWLYNPWYLPPGVEISTWVTYTVVYREKDGQSSSYTQTAFKSLSAPDPQEEAPAVNIAVSFAQDPAGKGAMAQAQVQAPDDCRVCARGQFEIEQPSIAYNISQGQYEITWGGRTGEHVYGDVSGFVSPPYFRSGPESRFKAWVVDRNLKIWPVKKTFAFPGHEFFTSQPPFNMEAGPDVLHFSLDPQSTGMTYTASGALPTAPVLAHQCTISMPSGTSHTAFEISALRGTNPPAITTQELVESSAFSAYNIGIGMPYRTVENGVLVTKPGVTGLFINSKIGGWVGRYSTCWSGPHKAVEVRIAPEGGPYLAFGGFHAGREYVHRKGWDREIRLKLWSYAVEPTDMPPAVLSFSHPCPYEGQTLPIGNEFWLPDSIFPPGPLTIAAQVNGAKARDPRDWSVLAEYSAISATATVNIFTFDVKAYIGNAEAAKDPYSGAYLAAEGQEITFAADIQGASFSSSQWYADAVPWEVDDWSYYSRLDDPCIVPGGSSMQTKLCFKVPYIEDPWYPGYGYKPQSAGYRVRCVIWHNRGMRDERRFEQEAFVRVSAAPLGEMDAVISDAAAGPERKAVTYSLPRDMDEVRIELFTQENPQQPIVYRNVLKGVDRRAGVRGPVEISDFFGQAIGEDCWARVAAVCSGELRQAEDRMWQVSGAIGSAFAVLPSQGKQFAIVPVQGRMEIKYTFCGKAPEADTVKYACEPGGTAQSCLAGYSEMLGDYDTIRAGLTVESKKERGILYLGGTTASESRVHPIEAFVSLHCHEGDTASRHPVLKSKWLSVYLMDMDVDSDNNSAIQAADEAVEDKAPGLIVQENNDNDDAEQEPADGQEIDDTNERIDGAQDLLDMKPCIIRPIPEGLPEGMIRLRQRGEGQVRVFDSSGRAVLSPSGICRNIWSEKGVKQGMVLQVEGVEPGKVVLAAEYISSGSTPICFLIDEVTITVVRMEFVIPGADYNNGENPNAEPVPTQFVGVSDPRPTVKLDPVSVPYIGGNENVIIQLSGKVHDPIADNVPAGKGADIESVKVYVNNQEYSAANVTRVKDAYEGFWKQHAYEGVFTTSAAVPVEEGTHIIRVETSENAAGNKGFAEVAVTLEKRDIPGLPQPPEGEEPPAQAVLNLYIPQNTSEQFADVLRFYYGEREPILPPAEPADAELVEAEGQEASLVFAGTVAESAPEIPAVSVPLCSFVPQRGKRSWMGVTKAHSLCKEEWAFVTPIPNGGP